MGKLNYSARKIDGVKAAQVVVRDLKKRITPGSGARNTSRDPILELDVSDKNLTDTGFAEVIDALLECMKYRDTEHPDGAAKLTELHLSGNQLTIMSLEKLGEVVELSSGDLRELDISRNAIDIRGDDDQGKGIWLEFLKAFAGCYVLKKLDLGMNRLGIAGIELLSRVYTRSDLDFFEEEDEEEIVVEEMATLDVNEKENDRGRSKKSPKGKARQNGTIATSGPSTTKTVSPADLKRYACTRGLRSVPYIILSNISLTTGAAIHLTSMILAHRNPEQLLPYLPPGKMPPFPDTDGRCNGLIWLPNDSLSDLGHKMLDSAETLRQFASEMLPEEDQAHREGRLPRDLEGVNLMDFMEQRRQHTKLNVEYTRIIKRARIEALRMEGVHAAELWGAALQMITMARTLLMDGSKRDAEEQSESENEQENVPPALSDPEPVPTQNGGLVSTSASSNRTSISMSRFTLHTPAQTQPVAPSNSVLGSSRTYAPLNYYAIEHERLLPSYPIHTPQTMPGAYPNCDHAFTTSSVGGPWSLDPVSGILYDERGRPANLHSQEYIQTSNYEAYVYSASVDPEPTPKGPFQPGGATFDVNFPALGNTAANKGPASGPEPIEPPVKEKIPVTPPQPQRSQQQRHQRQKSRAEHTNRTNEKRTSAQGQEKPRNLFHRLPLRVNCQIIARRAGAEGILSLAQQERLVKYATDWNSIAAEMRAQGAEEHQQIWKILDSVNCFTYSSLS
ncbi:uncharacterized protein ACHE_10539S [Aspergillus chevalieri]|uniref:Leucine rich repeat protein n=1 Tax=Aspergillus chevalieri TaxID=182096 RepID=A0A7R7VF63_ASPCH|nr:uncharacterized protein ACHE_10539S [Aspergillus chevalieri]BCR83137.1 hypothetical protein ACHE_10539S [Aspergillus chevalieri]